MIDFAKKTIKHNYTFLACFTYPMHQNALFIVSLSIHHLHTFLIPHHHNLLPHLLPQNFNHHLPNFLHLLSLIIIFTFVVYYLIFNHHLIFQYHFFNYDVNHLNHHHHHHLHHLLLHLLYYLYLLLHLTANFCLYLLHIHQL